MSKSQEKLMRVLEQSLLAHTKNDSSGASGVQKRELAELGKMLNRKDPPKKQKKPDQKLYTVLKGKKQKEEDYISMPIKKPESSKKEMKKPKRTLVDIAALCTQSAYSAPSYTSSNILRPQTKSAPSAPPLPPANQWNLRTGADLFVNPRTRLFDSGLDFDDELEIVLAESRKSAEQEDRLRTMYYEQHLASQVLEQRPEFSHEAPPKEVPFSSRNNSSIYYDDSRQTDHDDCLDSQDDKDSSDEWQPVSNRSSMKLRESLKSFAPSAKVSGRSEKKRKEANEISTQREEESEVPTSMGAMPKTKPKKSKKGVKKEEDFATIVETKLSEPQYPPKVQREKKSKSNRKSQSTTSVESKLHNLGIDNDFGCDELATTDSNFTNCQVNSMESRSSPDIHALKNEVDGKCNHSIEDNCEELYDFEAETGINYQVHELGTSPEPHTSRNNEDNESYNSSEPSYEGCEDEEYISEIETENYDFYPETSRVTRHSHPELFNRVNFVDYYGSFEDDFLPLLKNLPSPIVKHTHKSYQDNFPRPKIALSKFKDILETTQSDLRSDSGSFKSCHQAPVLKGREDQSFEALGGNEASAQSNATTNATNGKDLKKRPRLPGSGRFKIPSTCPESFNNQVSNAEKLQRILSGVGSDDLSENVMSDVPVRSKTDLTDSLKFSPSLEPIYERPNASSIKLHQDLNANPLSEKDPEGESSIFSPDLLPESLIKALAGEIKKLNLEEDENLRTEIQKIVTAAMQDPDSLLSKLVLKNMTKTNSEIPTKPSATAPSVISSQGTSLQTADNSIKPLPCNPFPSDSSPSTDQNYYSSHSKFYNNNNSIFQMEPQLPTDSFNHPFHQMVPNRGINMISHDALNPHQTSHSHSDQFNPQNFPCNGAIPPSLNSSDYFSSNFEVVDQASIVPTQSEEAITEIVKQTIVSVAGDVGNLFMNSPSFVNELPILVKTIQNQAINCANQESFVQSLVREYLSGSEFFCRSQPPPGFGAQAQHQATTNGSFPYSNFQEYPNRTLYHSVPSSQGAPYVISSVHNSAPTNLYVPSGMHSQIRSNINT